MSRRPSDAPVRACCRCRAQTRPSPVPAPPHRQATGDRAAQALPVGPQVRRRLPRVPHRPVVPTPNTCSRPSASFAVTGVATGPPSEGHCTVRALARAPAAPASLGCIVVLWLKALRVRWGGVSGRGIITMRTCRSSHSVVGSNSRLVPRASECGKAPRSARSRVPARTSASSCASRDAAARRWSRPGTRRDSSQLITDYYHAKLYDDVPS